MAMSAQETTRYCRNLKRPFDWVVGSVLLRDFVDR